MAPDSFRRFSNSSATGCDDDPIWVPMILPAMSLSCLIDASSTRTISTDRTTPTGWVKAKRLARSGVMPTLVATRSNLRDISPGNSPWKGRFICSSCTPSLAAISCSTSWP
ncbi:hypothetical protein D3C78_1683220 [compost metagenome]